MRPMLGWLLALTFGPMGAAAQAAPGRDSVRFVVLGHIRGDQRALSPKLAELLDRVRRLEPDFAVLTGDIIWGDVQRAKGDSATIEREWNTVDSALATLGIPVYRVPGNHDISDLVSRDIWRRRYGPLPNKVVVGDLRLLLLSSAWIPADGDTRHNPYVGGVDLDSAQVAWLERELSAPERYRETFVFLHHLLWWDEPDKPWWTTVHPILAKGGVSAVFSGDYGPLKFSTMEQDKVRYFQSSIELPVALPLLQNRPSSRLLSAQLDNYFEVVVDRTGADVRVHTVAEVSSGEFTPARYRAINSPPPEPLTRRLERGWRWLARPSRLGPLLGGVLAVFLAGMVVGSRRARARPGGR